MKDISMNQWRWGLIAVTLLHVVVLGLYLADVIPQSFHNPNSRFWLHHGGDNYDYVRLAHDLMQGELHANKYPLGFPLLLLPFMVVWGTAHDTLLPVVAIFWGALMFPVGQWLLAGIARQITGRRGLALLSVAGWTALPLVFYAVFSLISNAVVAETYSVHLTWFHMLSDGPSTLFTLLAMAAWLRLRASARPLRWAMLVGGLCGFLVLLRYTGGMTGLTLGLLLVIERRWREIALMAVTAVIVVSPQVAYNAHFFGDPFATGYTVLDDLPDDGLFSLSYLVDGVRGLSPQRQVLAALGTGGAAAATLMALRQISRQSRLYGLALLLWIVGFVGPYSVYYYSWTGSLARFLMPAYPALAILAAAAAGEAWLWVTRARIGRNPGTA